MPSRKKPPTPTPSRKTKRSARARPRKKKSARARPSESTDPPAAVTPTPQLPTIAGPTAEELAAHRSSFLEQASLVSQHGDNPQTDTHKEILSDTAFQRQELKIRRLALGVGKVYIARLQRLAGVVPALEKRLFSGEGSAQLSRADLIKLYRLASAELNKSGKFLMYVLSNVNMDALRERLAALRKSPDARPPAEQGPRSSQHGLDPN